MLNLDPSEPMVPAGLHEGLRRVLGHIHRLESIASHAHDLEFRLAASREDLEMHAKTVKQLYDESNKMRSVVERTHEEMDKLKIKALQLEAQRDAMVEAHRVAVGIAAGQSSAPQYVDEGESHP